MSLFKIVVLGTPGVGKKSLAHALLRNMGESGGDYEDIETALKQNAIINNQKCILECEDVFVEDEEEDGGESSALIPKESARPGKRGLLKRGKDKVGGVSGPRLRKKESVFDKAKVKSGLAKAKLVGKMAAQGAEMDQYPTGYVVVFDIGDMKSFHEAENQLDRLQEPPKTEEEQRKHVVLVGNKTDKSRRYRRITYEEGLKLSQKYPDVPYSETSAKLYQRVDQVFEKVVKQLQTSIVNEDEAAAAANGGAGSNGGTGGGGGGTSGGGGSASSGTDTTDPAATLAGAADNSDIVEGNLIYDNCCCKCCPKAFRKCGKKCGKKCCVVM